VVLLKILFKEVGFQMFSEDGQGLYCHSLKGEAVSTTGVPRQRAL
jgi:hypothetical protein